MTTKRYLLAQTALCTSLIIAFGTTGTQAADVTRVNPPATLPAVSGINGKIDFAAGTLTPAFGSQTGVWRIQGAVSIPLDYSFGLQIDGVLGSLQSQTFTHVAAHAFWRNPAQGLLGGYAAFSTWNGLNRQRLAVEGEAYLGAVSLETLSGFEMGDVPSSFFTVTDAALYLNPNFRISAGFRYNGAGTAFAGGLEYQFASGSLGGWAGFVDGEFGSNGYQKLFAGIRLYVGTDKSLVRRHREDDPRIKADEQSLTNCGTGAVVTDGFVALDSNSENVSCGTELAPV